MTEEQTETTQTPPVSEGTSPDEKRERSTIEFPYNDLDDAVKIAKAVHDNAGLSCTLDQLAAYLKQSMTSGSFRLRVANASTFGLTANERGSVTLTELGRRIADKNQEAEARAESFLQVELYGRIYENYKGFTLPPAGALEKFMREVGVSSKQTGKARQAFMRSAKQAGFFAHGEDRLVRPAGPGTKPITPPGADSEKIKEDADIKKPLGNGGGGGDGDRPEIDPIIAGLLKRLPKAGDVWPEADRKLWLELLAGSFKLIYQDSDAPERRGVPRVQRLHPRPAETDEENEDGEAAD